MAEYHATLDEVTFALLTGVASAADAAAIPWMITGASARVILLESAFGLPQGRRTEDIDFAVVVESWPHFEELVANICHDQRFTKDPRQVQRIRYGDDHYLGLVPFGGIESGSATVEWPPDGEMVMSVAGFRDVLASVIPVRINDTIDVPFGSPAGLFTLKLLAWGERRIAQPRRDAEDLAYFLRHAADLVTQSALFDQHLPIVERFDYDIYQAACFVLGSRVAALASDVTKTRIAAILNTVPREGEEAALARDVANAIPAFDHTLALLQGLTQGFQETADR